MLYLRGGRRRRGGIIWGGGSKQKNPFFFACLEATELISMMFTFAEVFTVLKMLEIFSSPAIPARSSLLLISMACFDITVRSSVLKSYWVTSDIASAVRTLEAKYYALSSVGFL